MRHRRRCPRRQSRASDLRRRGAVRRELRRAVSQRSRTAGSAQPLRPDRGHRRTRPALPPTASSLARRVPIGRPIAEHRGLRARRRPAAGAARACRASCTSAGAGLARGYLGRPELTAERFVPDPFGREPASADVPHRRPGALARRRRCSSSSGRTDHQVKIRGFRIELGEIEAALARAPGVARGGGGRARGPARRQAAGRLRGAARRAAPTPRRCARILRPAAAGLHGARGVRAAGRAAADRQRQARPRCAAGAGVDGGRRCAAPRTPHEEILAACSPRCSALERVGIDDNFFELGGHSLLATRLISRIRAARSDVELPLRACSRRRPSAGLAAASATQARAARPALDAPCARPAERSRCRSRSSGSGSWIGSSGAAPPTTIPVALRLTGAARRRRRCEAALGDRRGAARERCARLSRHATASPVQVILDGAAARPRLAAYRSPRRACPRSARRRGAPRLRPGDRAAAAGAAASRSATTSTCCCSLLHHIVRRRLIARRPLWRELAARLSRPGATGRRPICRALPVQYADYALGSARCWARTSDPQSTIRASWRSGPTPSRVCPISSTCRPTGRARRCRAIAATASRFIAAGGAARRPAGAARARARASLFMVLQAALAALADAAGRPAPTSRSAARSPAAPTARSTT